MHPPVAPSREGIELFTRRLAWREPFQPLTFNQCVFVCGRGPSQNSQLGPDLVNALLLNLSERKSLSSLCRSMENVMSHNKNILINCIERCCISTYKVYDSIYDYTSPFSFRIRRLNSLPSIHRKSSPGWMIPHLMAMARAVLMLSPVTMRTVIPARWHFLIASGTWWGKALVFELNFGQ